MERLDLVSLKLFVSVAEEGNIAHAAAREHIAASAISKRLQELEIELQAPLFRCNQKGRADSRGRRPAPTRQKRILGFEPHAGRAGRVW